MSLADLLNQLDSLPGVRGRQFERLCGWYLRNAPEYRDRIRNVWLWSEWPGAWAPDAGIDLVAEDRDGGPWAVQAKAYAPSYAIKKADVDSFLSESSRPQFSFRLLIATTDHLGPTARRTLDAQREPVGYLLRSQLELAQVVWPSSLSDLRPRRPPRKKPFPHVREAIEATVEGFADEQRGQLIMACGTGKTLAAMWIAERLGSNRTLVLVPSLSLLAQTLREWSANASGPFEYLAVCSDPTVVGEDRLVEHTVELGFPVTTDPSNVAAFLGRRGRCVVFATYQSSPQIAAAFHERTPQFDLAIADEAHRCAGRTSSEFATILDAAQIRSRRRLFMTATPRFYTPRVRSEAGQLGVDVASMDDETVFGPVLHRLTFGEAIKRDLLSDYQVVVVGVDDEMYRAWAERGEFVTRDGKKATDARSLAGQIGLAKSMRKYELRRIISFHGRVKAAREFSAEIPSVIRWMPTRMRPAGPIWSEHVSGEMTSGHRDRLLLRFRKLAPEERGLLSNARCLGEGVDVPSIDGIAFIDPRRSTIDIVQAVGRAIRKSPDKRIGTIVLPVFLAATEDPGQALNESAFQHVWDVLKALRAHDETLGEELDELRRRLGARRGAPWRPGKIKLDIPRTVGIEFARAFDVRLVEQTTASWEFFFGLLQRFAEREGHARVPQATREDGFRLGGWVSWQRYSYHQGTLEADRSIRLEALPGWTWTADEDTWEEGFAHLLKFVQREGHALVPVAHKEDGHNLGTWVDTQRQAYSDTRSAVARGAKAAKAQLTPERIARLEALPRWTWHRWDSAWDENLRLLEQYVKRTGHSQVPYDYSEDGHWLGRWASKQRTLYQVGKLSRTRIHRLRTLPGWTWDVRESAWKEGFDALEAFAAERGHANVPGQYVMADGFALGHWVTYQRSYSSDGTLPEKRRRQLESVQGWTWDVRQSAWEEGFAALRHFVEERGHALVPAQFKSDDEFRLGQWVVVQRQRALRDVISSEEREKLESLAGWSWSPHEDTWEHRFEKLSAYVSRTGTFPRVKNRDNGFLVGNWLDAQRQAYKRGDLSSERIERLEGLPGWMWNPKRDTWGQFYDALRAYVSRERNAAVPRAHVEGELRLGQWVNNQRQLYKRGKLSSDRVRRLEAVAGWQWTAKLAQGVCRRSSGEGQLSVTRSPQGTGSRGHRPS